MTTITAPSASRPMPVLRRLLGVVTEPQSYRNLTYLLLGLPLGVTWFTVLVTGVTVSASLLVVALLGVPLLLGTLLLARACANVERVVASALLGVALPAQPVPSGSWRHPWTRLRATWADPGRRREVTYLLLRFPAGVVTFTAAIAALAVPVAVAYAPIAARIEEVPSFGTWPGSTAAEELAVSAWSWVLVPVGAVLLVGALHLINTVARACGRWNTSALG